MRKVKQFLSLFLVIMMTANLFLYCPKTVKAAQSIKEYEKIDGISSDTVLGADFTHYQQNLEWNKIYYNYKDEKISNIFTFMKTQGINTISVKVAVNPTGDNEYLSLENAKKTLKAAKQAGLNTNVVLLYSDEMTYANVQKLPAGWDKDTAGAKALEYTVNTIQALKNAEAMPTMVTIGNEFNWNFLGFSGDHDWKGWEAIGKITNAVKNEYPDVKTAVSIAAPDSAADVEWVLDKLNNQWNNVNYDYLGVNLYPNETTPEYMKTLRSTFERVEKNAQKDAQLIVSNVSYPRISDSDKNISVQSQADNIYQLLKSTIDENNAGGIIYDKADCVGDWNSFFDEYGIAETSLAVFAFAKGNKVDVTTYRDPYQFGGETGLKDQKVKISKISTMSDSTMRGIDISSYIALKEAGVKFYDYEGKEAPLLKTLHESGVNYVRIRIWNDPYNENGETYGGGANDIKRGLEIAQEAAKYDIKILLNFHYSDFWADPSQQIVPKAWENDVKDASKMRANVYNFTKDTINKFKETGAEIGMVQVGNEITNGMLGVITDRDQGGSYYTVWGDKNKSALVDSYLNAGIKAVRECAPDALVALHIETPNVKKYTNIMNAWKRDKVDYDVLGSSYYPYWSTSSKANTPKTLKDVQNLAASYGKMFAVLETGWVNSLKDADGTPNSIGESHNTSAYSVGPQGQVDELTDLYKTVTSQANGLGAFYWEAAWIPVKAGWNNWQYNKEMADIYGTGWASKGAVGYFSDSKLYYNDQPAWGGTSWDNQTLFDMNGYPLQSLNFYKDSVSKGKEQTTVLCIQDKKGNVITNQRFVKIDVGKSKTITLPKINGYIPPKNSYKLKITGTKDGVLRKKITYTRTPQGPAKKYNYRVKIKSKKYKVYKNFKWKKSKTKPYNKTYVAKYIYNHENGRKYLSIYTLSGKWVGYINSKAAKKIRPAKDPLQGKAYKYGKKVRVTKTKYKLYKNFKWSRSKTKPYKKTYVAKYLYNHENGYKYLSLYTSKGKWIGYINSKAVTTIK